jgi:hypothetical protein
MLDQFASSYGLLEEVDWQCIFSSFYEVVRMKIKCTDMSKFPKEMLFCIDKKLYKIVIDIDMGKMDSAADRGKGDGSGIDKKDEKDDEDNLDDVDDLGEDTTHDVYMDVSRNENESQLEQKGQILSGGGRQNQKQMEECGSECGQVGLEFFQHGG